MKQATAHTLQKHTYALLHSFVALQILVLCLLFIFFPPTGTLRAEPQEYQVKAAYLYNFLRFINWPSDNGKSLSICTTSTDPFGATLTKIGEKKVGGKSINIRRNIAINETGDCNVLFISGSELEELNKVAPHIDGRPVVTVSDIKNFAREGGIIGFTTIGGSVKLEINLAKAREKNLQITAMLLEVAHKVIK